MVGKDETKNGLEMLLTSQLLIELFEEYKVVGREKQLGKRFIEAVTLKTERYYNQVFSESQEFTVNSLKMKERLIKQIAQMNEADVILFSEFTNRYVKNIDVARKKGVVFFDKLLS